MDPILQTLLSWQFILFSLSISAVMFVIKTVVEYLMDNWTVAAKESKFWNNLIAPILPIVLGGAVGWVFKKFPYPDNLVLKWDRIMFGLVAGLLSTFLYGVIKGLLAQKISSIIPSTTPTTTTVIVDSTSPPVPPSTQLPQPPSGS